MFKKKWKLFVWDYAQDGALVPRRIRVERSYRTERAARQAQARHRADDRHCHPVVRRAK